MHGKPSADRGWIISIPDPSNTATPLTILESSSSATSRNGDGTGEEASHGTDTRAARMPADVSAVTSGIYERLFTVVGAAYHHILDPHDGYPARTDLTSATVIARKSTDAEGYSTTLLALGAERAERFAAIHPEILVILSTARSAKSKGSLSFRIKS